MNQDVEMVRLLLSFGAPIDYSPNEGKFVDFSPLYLAALNGYSKIAELLIHHGAIVDFAPPSHGMTPLAAAIDSECDFASQTGLKPTMVIARLLLAACADPTLKSVRGKSAYDLAVIYRQEDALASFRGLSRSV